MYVEPLIGPDTVNTMPPATLDAFRDHGVVRASVEEELEGAEATMAALVRLGIDMDEVTAQLLDDGVKIFADSFHQLMDCISAQRTAILSGARERQVAILGEHQPRVSHRLERLEKEIALEVRDAYLSVANEWENLKAAESSVALNEENLRLQQALYESGAGTLLEWDNARLDMRRAEVSLIQAQINLLLAHVRFRKAVGE